MTAIDIIDDINAHGIEPGHDRGAWMQTTTGKRFYPLDPHPSEVCIEDISHSLAQLARFNGHTSRFYSVAQHSCLVHDYMPDDLKFLGLMHDATEAYIGDMIRPLKYYNKFFQDVEERVWEAIRRKFKITKARKAMQVLKHWDNKICAAEKRDLHPQSEFWFGMPECEEVRPITPWSPRYAKGQFMRRFNDLQ